MSSSLQCSIVSVIILIKKKLVFLSQEKKIERKDSLSRCIPEKMNLGKIVSKHPQSSYSALCSKTFKEDAGTS